MKEAPRGIVFESGRVKDQEGPCVYKTDKLSGES